MLLNYPDDDYPKECGKMKDGFRALTKFESFQLYITDQDVISSYNDDDVGVIYEFSI